VCVLESGSEGVRGYVGICRVLFKCEEVCTEKFVGVEDLLMVGGEVCGLRALSILIFGAGSF
jgi:hypothetical protein